MRRTLMGACAIAAVCGWPAGAADEPVSALETNRRIVLRRHEASVQAYQGNADVLVLPGLVADRKARRILLDVATTGVEKGKPIEFWLIGDTSGHGYESLAMAFAKPSAVHRALEFIGLKPGRPVNANAMQFWSKGERVFVSLTRAAGDPPEKAVRMESLLHDTRTGKPLAETGFAFTGSVQVPPEKARDVNRYGADLFEPIRSPRPTTRCPRCWTCRGARRSATCTRARSSPTPASFHPTSFEPLSSFPNMPTGSGG